MKIGILSCYSNPLLPLLLNDLNKFKIEKFFVILDKQDFSKNQNKLWKKRTGKNFLANLTISDCHNPSVPFYFVDSHNSSNCITLLRKLRPAVLINGGTPRKLRPEILKLPRKGVINVHPGILPKYRGADCVEWAVLNNDPIGNSAHLMTADYDQGPIIKKELVEVSATDKYQTVRKKMYIAWSALMCRAILLVLDKDSNFAKRKYKKNNRIYSPMPQNKLNKVLNSLASGMYYRKIFGKK